ncbi:MAG: MFS transporter, partial [Thermoflexales bacterium]|nr:MFS transporter [Thermoflexales bacterium]
VPLLALAGRWETAVGLMLAERAGKAIRTPARDVLLARVAQHTGRGWGFGVHEALDQIGAVLGPVVIAGVLATRQDYREGFALLAAPAALTLAVLVVLWRLFPRSEAIRTSPTLPSGSGLPRGLGAYLVAAAALGAGFADFPLIAFHLKSARVAPEEAIPLLYALGMASDALAALVLGRLFDQRGLRVLSVAALIGAGGIPLAFLGNLGAAALGVVLWGVGLGAQESILRAAIGAMVEPERQGAAYGAFNAAYGVAWFSGSAAMGALYSVHPLGLVLFGVSAQVVAAGLFWRMRLPARAQGG